MPGLNRLFLGVLLCFGALCAEAFELSEEPAWVEDQITLPAFPKDGELIPFEVSALATNHFFIDANSLSLGQDGVLRYTLVVEAPSGVRNVSYEGLRCNAGERRVYALGSSDGKWVAARNSAWLKIRNTPLNRQHAALYMEYFCVPGVEVRSAAAAIEVLRRGGVRTIF